MIYPWMTFDPFHPRRIISQLFGDHVSDKIFEKEREWQSEQRVSIFLEAKPEIFTAVQSVETAFKGGSLV